MEEEESFRTTVGLCKLTTASPPRTPRCQRSGLEDHAGRADKQIPQGAGLRTTGFRCSASLHQAVKAKVCGLIPGSSQHVLESRQFRDQTASFEEISEGDVIATLYYKGYSNSTHTVKTLSYMCIQFCDMPAFSDKPALLYKKKYTNTQTTCSGYFQGQRKTFILHISVTQSHKLFLKLKNN